MTIPTQFLTGRNKGESVKEVLAYIDREPGATPKQVKAHMGYSSHGAAYSLVERLIRVGKIQKRVQDNKVRYYPANYRFSHPAAKDGPVVVSNPAIDYLEEKAKDYAWRHPETASMLRAFFEEVVPKGGKPNG